MRLQILVFLLLNSLCAAGRAAITFTPGHFYSTDDSTRDIFEYDETGAFLGSVTLSATLADDLRGLAFGPDGLLYVTATKGSGFNVLAIDHDGVVLQTYSRPSVYIAGNSSYGKLAVDANYLYVAGGNLLTRFPIGNPAGTSIYGNNQVFDVEILPSGNLLVASAYDVEEITSTGSLVRSIDPGPGFFTDVRGVEYDPVSNKVFVTHLGHSNFFFRIMRFDAATTVYEENATFSYADDLFITDSGNLLVGSRTDPPRVYTQGLDQIGTLGTSDRKFVTQLVVPEPEGILLVATAALALLSRRLFTSSVDRPVGTD
jgi:hypothetical protein